MLKLNLFWNRIHMTNLTHLHPKCRIFPRPIPRWWWKWVTFRLTSIWNAAIAASWELVNLEKINKEQMKCRDFFVKMSSEIGLLIFHFAIRFAAATNHHQHVTKKISHSSRTSNLHFFRARVVFSSSLFFILWAQWPTRFWPLVS